MGKTEYYRSPFTSLPRLEKNTLQNGADSRRSSGNYMMYYPISYKETSITNMQMEKNKLKIKKWLLPCSFCFFLILLIMLCAVFTLIVVALLIIQSHQDTPSPQYAPQSVKKFSEFVVITSHNSCTQIAKKYLEEVSPNIYDAAVAAQFCLFAAMPWAASLGGGGMAMVFDEKTERLHSGNPAMPRVFYGKLTDEAIDKYIPASTIGTPRVLAMLATLNLQYGNKTAPIISLLNSTLQLLKEGISCNLRDLHGLDLSAALELLEIPDNDLCNEKFHRPLYADFLQKLAGDNENANMEDAEGIFYSNLSENFAQEIESGGGHIDRDDFYNLVLDYKKEMSQITTSFGTIYLPKFLAKDETSNENLSLLQTSNMTHLDGKDVEEFLLRLDEERQLNSDDNRWTGTNVIITNRRGQGVILTNSLGSKFGSNMISSTGHFLYNNGLWRIAQKLSTDQLTFRQQEIIYGSTGIPVLVRTHDSLHTVAMAVSGPMSVAYKMLEEVDFDNTSRSLQEAMEKQRIIKRFNKLYHEDPNLGPTESLSAQTSLLSSQLEELIGCLDTVIAAPSSNTVGHLEGLADRRCLYASTDGF